LKSVVRRVLGYQRSPFANVGKKRPPGSESKQKNKEAQAGKLGNEKFDLPTKKRKVQSSKKEKLVDQGKRWKCAPKTTGKKAPPRTKPTASVARGRIREERRDNLGKKKY